MPAYRGIPIAPGIGIGPVFHFGHSTLTIDRYKPDSPDAEWERFESARRVACVRLQSRYEHAVSILGSDEAAIFRAHLTILDDPELREGVETEIRTQTKNAEAAVYDISEMYSKQLEAIDDVYLQTRAIDIRDVRDTILAALIGNESPEENRLTNPSIVLSRFLTPSDCISMDQRLILGFCTMEGSKTSHVAILARSLGIPAIAGVEEEALQVGAGTPGILDGDSGEFLHDVDQAVFQEYHGRRESRDRLQAEAKSEADLPAITRDGHRVLVVANLGSAEPAAVQACLENGAEGVGLLRTEFVYLECSSMPDEEQQYHLYRSVTKPFGQRPVILRTVDIGGDKNLPYFELPHELNPFLGVRGLRLSLKYPDMFKAQLRAALRAGHNANLQLMFPMVTKVSEVRAAKRLLEEAKAELEARGATYATAPEVGIMVEVPAAALLSEQLAKEVDFLSIGTNDLSQYTLAMDRTNNQLAQLIDALDPSVLRLIAQVIEAAHKHGKRAGVCGELAGEPVAIPILLGLGLDEFSMNAPAIPSAKRLIRRLDMAESKELARRALGFESPADVRTYVEDSLRGLEVLLTA